jgi:prepilin-type N-terminal cleavage/methylation domain-containing protein
MRVNIKNKKTGFTLIELMVSVTLFAVVMVISMGAILTIVDGNKKNQTMQVAINNLNFAVESMTRSIKTGYNYEVTNEVGECKSLSLNITEDQDGNDVDDAVNYYLKEFPGGDNSGLFYHNLDTDYEGFITAPDLNITDLCFRKTDDLQPALTIVIQGETTGSKEGLKTTFNLFTSVTQRQVQYD